METLRNEIISLLESRYTLEPTPVPEDLREINRLMGLMKINMYNWKMEKVRKISIMRLSVRVPQLDVFGIEMYPDADYDLPLLAIDFSCMKKKTFVYINVIPLFADTEYQDKYIAPLKEVFDKDDIVPQKQPKEWMLPYVTDCTVYAMPDNSLLDKARACARDYLAYYLDMLDGAAKIADQDYRQKVEAASLHYCNELSEKDGSRKMLARFIGADKANRIFREVIR